MKKRQKNEIKKKEKRIAREAGELVFALLIAWVGYQLLAAVTGTALPIVAVVSDSMYHNNPYDAWWFTNGGYYDGIGVTKDEFSKFSFPNGMLKGDLIFVVNQQPSVGDVVIYQRNSITIIHRVIEVTDNGYVIKGDNNPSSDENGVAISQERIRGKALFSVPLLGFPRTLIFEIFRI